MVNMATSSLQILLSVLFLSDIGVQVNGEVKRYTLDFFEKGSLVTEEVDVDIDNGTEVFRVPRHNNKEPMDVMHDFQAKLTARRLLSSQECFVAKLDSALTSPQKLKFDMELATKQPLSGTKKVIETRTKVLGFADRLALPQSILDFCGSLPIYNVEDVSVDGTNASTYDLLAQGRHKRQNTFYLITCSPGGSPSIFPGKKQMMEAWLSQKGSVTMTCKSARKMCYLAISCRYVVSSGYHCDTFTHVFHSGVCCDVSTG